MALHMFGGVCANTRFPQCTSLLSIICLQYSMDTVLTVMPFFHLLALFIFFPHILVYGSHIPSHSCAPPNLSSAFFTWFSCLFIHLCEGIEISLFIDNVDSIFLRAARTLMCGHLLFRCPSLCPCFSGHFSSRWDLLSSSVRKRLEPLFVPPSSL
jgi:hypothetical protein